MTITNNSECKMCIQEENSLDYINYAYVYIVLLNKTEENLTLSKIKNKAEDKIMFDFGEDGYYTVMRVLVHKLDESSSEESLLDEEESDDMIFDYDGTDFFFNDTKVDLKYIVDHTSAKYVEYSGFFSTCLLRKCLISLCKKVLEKGLLYGNKCSVKADADSIYLRDLVWSVYNIIQYLLDFGKYDEAQRLLERVNVCPGICHGVEKENGGGCGCHG